MLAIKTAPTVPSLEQFTLVQLLTHCPLMAAIVAIWPNNACDNGCKQGTFQHVEDSSPMASSGVPAASHTPEHREHNGMLIVVSCIRTLSLYTYM